MNLTPEQLAYAKGFFDCFLAEGFADIVGTDYETWFEHGDMDFKLHFDNDGLVVVDAYKTQDGLTNTRVSLRILMEDNGKVQA